MQPGYVNQHSVQIVGAWALIGGKKKEKRDEPGC